MEEALVSHFKRLSLTLILGLLFYHSSTAGAQAMTKPEIKKEPFGKTPNQQQVDVYTLINSNCVEARIITYGGIVISLKVPDRSGKLGDVVLGYDNLDGYLKSTPFFGAIIGRYGNRIGKGKFVLNGKTYELPRNDGEN